MKKFTSQSTAILIRILCFICYIVYPFVSNVLWYEGSQGTVSPILFRRAKYIGGIVLGILVCAAIHWYVKNRQHVSKPAVVLDGIFLVAMLLYRNRVIYNAISNPELYYLMLVMFFYFTAYDFWALYHQKQGDDSVTPSTP